MRTPSHGSRASIRRCPCTLSSCFQSQTFAPSLGLQPSLALPFPGARVPRAEDVRLPGCCLLCQGGGEPCPLPLPSLPGATGSVQGGGQGQPSFSPALADLPSLQGPRVPGPTCRRLGKVSWTSDGSGPRTEAPLCWVGGAQARWGLQMPTGWGWGLPSRRPSPKPRSLLHPNSKHLSRLLRTYCVPGPSVCCGILIGTPYVLLSRRAQCLPLVTW